MVAVLVCSTYAQYSLCCNFLSIDFAIYSTGPVTPVGVGWVAMYMLKTLFYNYLVCNDGDCDQLQLLYIHPRIRGITNM